MARKALAGIPPAPRANLGAKQAIPEAVIAEGALKPLLRDWLAGKTVKPIDIFQNSPLLQAHYKSETGLAARLSGAIGLDGVMASDSRYCCDGEKPKNMRAFPPTRENAATAARVLARHNLLDGLINELDFADTGELDGAIAKLRSLAKSIAQSKRTDDA